MSSEGCESWEAEASWPSSLSPSDSRCALKPGMALGSTGCRTCRMWRFLAKCKCCDFVFLRSVKLCELGEEDKER